jgi:uncharacterized protein YjbI with pentapeptide repeats
MNICGWEFKPDRWEDKYETRAVPDAAIKCEREVPNGATRCIYHEDLRENDGIDITPEEAFCELLKESEPVFGARFQLIELDRIDIGTDHSKVYLRNVVVSGGFRISQFNSAVNVTFAGCVFDGIQISNANISSLFSIKNCHVRGETTIRRCEMTRKLQADHTIFSDYVRISGHFHDQVQLLRCEFTAGLLIDDSVFAEIINFKQSKFGDDTYFYDCDMNRHLKLSEATPSERLFISRCDIHRISCNFTSSNSTIVLFHGTTIRNGDLHQPQSENTYFDLTNTTLGEVYIQSEFDLSQYHFNNTRYNGFQFYLHQGQFSIENWRIHKFTPPHSEKYYSGHTSLASSISPPPTPEYEHNMELKDKTETYLLAREAAARQGDNYSASKLHIVEMKSEKERHKDSMLNSQSLTKRERFRSFIQYATNQFYRGVCVYGESPKRVFVISIIVILASSIILSFKGGVSNGATVISYQTMAVNPDITFNQLVAATLYTSGASFTSLGSGTYHPMVLLTRFLLMVESVIGAFLIALFVFTLGRQIRR